MLREAEKKRGRGTLSKMEPATLKIAPETDHAEGFQDPFCLPPLGTLANLTDEIGTSTPARAPDNQFRNM